MTTTTASSTAPGTLIGLLHGLDRRGLVARVAGWIYERGGNIVHADQHTDAEAGVFFQRMVWQPLGHSTAVEADAFRHFGATELGMHTTVTEAARRPRVALLVSRQDHCFHDLCLRWQAGEFAGDIVGVLSNHGDLRAAAAHYGLPYVEVAVTPASKAAAEAEQLRQLRQWGAEVVVLARYMQVLSAEFLAQVGVPVINIHHSFLPAFAGARPYHQAYTRGVKLIGATAHYVTPVLDDGPIIEQQVARVSHRHGVNDLIRLGKDLEKATLARALRLHLEGRVLVYGNKTVVFD